MRCVIFSALLPLVLAVDECVYHTSRDGVAEVSWLSTVFVVGLPAVCMMIGSLVFLCIAVSDNVLAVFQNISAGILVAAVGNELFPLLRCGTPAASHAPGTVESWAGLIGGFVVGVCFMYSIDIVVDSLSEEEEEVGAEDPTSPAPAGRAGTELTETDPLKNMANEGKDYSSTTRDLECEDVSHFVNARSQYVKDLENLVDAVSDLSTAAQKEGATRDELDEVIHIVEYNVDVTKRHLRKPRPMNDDERKEIREHVLEMKKSVDMASQAANFKAAAKLLSDVSQMLDHVHSHAEAQTVKRKWKNVRISVPIEKRVAVTEENIKWGEVVAVSIDACTDGLLIGLAFSASTTAGLSMSIATTIEMGFLGLSFSADLGAQVPNLGKHILISAIPPCCIFGMGMAGKALGAVLEEHQGLFIGFIGFAMVALMYLVTQELLVESHENGEKNTKSVRICGGMLRIGAERIQQLISTMFFVGMLGGIAMDKLLG